MHVRNDKWKSADQERYEVARRRNVAMEKRQILVGRNPNRGSSANFVALRVTDTMRDLINSNDFGRFGIFSSRFEFEIYRLGLYFKKTIRFFVCSGFDHVQCVTLYIYMCCGLFSHMWLIRCNSKQTHTQTTYTAQTHHTSIPIVVVALLIHGHMCVYKKCV